MRALVLTIIFATLILHPVNAASERQLTMASVSFGNCSAKHFVKKSVASRCQARAIDCAGAFYDSIGRQVQPPQFPAANKSDEDVTRWKQAVEAFYRNSFVDRAGKQQLSPGKASLCTAWMVERSTPHDSPVPKTLERSPMQGAE